MSFFEGCPEKPLPLSTPQMQQLRSSWSAYVSKKEENVHDSIRWAILNQSLRDLAYMRAFEVDFNVCPRKGVATYLAHAIARDNRQVITALLEAGANPNVETPTHSQALKIALIKEGDDPDLIELLLNYGGIVNTVWDDGYFLDYLVKNFPEKTKTIDLLRRRGAVHHPAQGKQLLLNEAIRNDDLAAVRKLLDNGLHLETRMKTELTGLMFSSFLGKERIVDEYLARGANVNARGMFGEETSLTLAAHSNFAGIVKKLIAAGARIEPGLHERSALVSAAMVGSVESVVALLEAGADPDACHNTPYHLAMDKQNALFGCATYTDPEIPWTRRMPILELLLKHGASTKPCLDAQGSDTLHFAAQYGRDDVLRLLIRYNVDVEQRNKRTGETPLEGAVRNGRAGAVRILLDAGANPNISAKIVIFEHAFILHPTNIAKTLKEAQAKWNKPALAEKDLNGGNDADAKPKTKKGLASRLKRMF
ncbi:hypothetical protein HDU88_003319 [Geranomyces variabilis]|nr:hypothetical protein HDU88_003319 [Geranomyces variabilis]